MCVDKRMCVYACEVRFMHVWRACMHPSMCSARVGGSKCFACIQQNDVRCAWTVRGWCMAGWHTPPPSQGPHRFDPKGCCAACNLPHIVLLAHTVDDDKAGMCGGGWRADHRAPPGAGHGSPAVLWPMPVRTLSALSCSQQGLIDAILQHPLTLTLCCRVQAPECCGMGRARSAVTVKVGRSCSPV